MWSKGKTEDEIVDGISNLMEISEGHENMACCSPWGHTESNVAEIPNNNNNKIHVILVFI